jgi:hypothetical protein
MTTEFTFTCALTRVNGWWRAERDGHWYDAPTPLRAVAGLLMMFDDLAQTLPPLPIEYRGKMVKQAVPVVSFSLEEMNR